MLLNKTMPIISDTRNFYAEEANFWLSVFPDLVDVVTVNLAEVVPVDLVDLVDIPGDKIDTCGDGNSTTNFNSSANILPFNWTVSFSISICLWIVSAI